MENNDFYQSDNRRINIRRIPYFFENLCAHTDCARCLWDSIRRVPMSLTHSPRLFSSSSLRFAFHVRRIPYIQKAVKFVPRTLDCRLRCGSGGRQLHPQPELRTRGRNQSFSRPSLPQSPRQTPMLYAYYAWDFTVPILTKLHSELVEKHKVNAIVYGVHG